MGHSLDMAGEKRFTAAFEAHKHDVYDFALRMLGDTDSAGDVTQEVFIRLYRSLTDHSAILDLKSWLFICTRNLCLNYRRDRGREISLEDAPASRQPTVDQPDRSIDAVRKALAALDTKFREAIILREMEGFSYREIAHILQITVPAVRMLLYKARLALREKLKSTYPMR